jgi:hypothetical protein
MGPYGWLLTFALTIVVVLITAGLLKLMQNAVTSAPKSRSKDEDNNGKKI